MNFPMLIGFLLVFMLYIKNDTSTPALSLPDLCFKLFVFPCFLFSLTRCVVSVQLIEHYLFIYTSLSAR